MEVPPGVAYREVVDFRSKIVVVRTVDDPLEGEIIEADGRDVAELSWSREDGAVRIEAADGVWRAFFTGWWPLRCALVAPDGRRRMVSAGVPENGVVLAATGEEFRVEGRRMGLKTVVSDSEGREVIRSSIRVSWRSRPVEWTELRVAGAALSPDAVTSLVYTLCACGVYEMSAQEWPATLSRLAPRRSAQRAVREMAGSLRAQY